MFPPNPLRVCPLPFYLPPYPHAKGFSLCPCLSLCYPFPMEPDYTYDPKHPDRRLYEAHEPDKNFKPTYFGLPKTDSSINEEKRIRETLPDFYGKPKEGFNRFYHYTDPKSVDSILKKGLLRVQDGRPRSPGYADHEGDGIWMSSKPPIIPRTTMILDLPKDFPLEQANQSEFISWENPIPPQYINSYDRPAIIWPGGQEYYLRQLEDFAKQRRWKSADDFDDWVRKAFRSWDEGAERYGNQKTDHSVYDYFWPQLKRYWE